MEGALLRWIVTRVAHGGKATVPLGGRARVQVIRVGREGGRAGRVRLLWLFAQLLAEAAQVVDVG